MRVVQELLGPRVGDDDADLHAGDGRPAARGLRHRPSAGPGLSGADRARGRPTARRTPVRGARPAEVASRLPVGSDRQRSTSLDGLCRQSRRATAGEPESGELFAVAPRSVGRPGRRPAEAHAARTRPARAARPGAHHRPVQPEGRRRQDDLDDQPGCRAGRARPPRAARRLRPAGRAVGRPRRAAAPARPHRLQPADGARRHRRRRPAQDQRRRHGPAAEQHRPVGGRGAAGRRGRPRADAGARAGARSSTTTTSS